MLMPIIIFTSTVLDIYSKLIIVQFIVSWLIYFNVINTHQQLVGTIINFLYQITEPFYRRIRKFIPAIGGIDLSPVVALLILYFVQLVLWQSIAPLLS